MSVVQRHGGSTASVRSIAHTLDSLAESFYATGNAYLGDKLTGFAERLFEAAEASDMAFSEVLSDSVRQIQLSERNFLVGVLASVGAYPSPDDQPE